MFISLRGSLPRRGDRPHINHIDNTINLTATITYTTTTTNNNNDNNDNDNNNSNYHYYYYGWSKHGSSMMNIYTAGIV